MVDGKWPFNPNLASNPIFLHSLGFETTGSMSFVQPVILINSTMRHFFYLFILAILPLFESNAGPEHFSWKPAPKYKWALGARLGSPLSASVKYFHNRVSAFEFTAGYYRYNDNGSWKQVTVSYQFHLPLTEKKLLHFYAGLGLASMFWTYGPGWGAGTFPENTYASYLLAGLDYRFKSVPLNLSLDWTPYFQFSGVDEGLGISYGSLAVRYILK